jgi:hypothetical protein
VWGCDPTFGAKSQNSGAKIPTFRASPPVEFLEGILALKGYIFSSNYT